MYLSVHSNLGKAVSSVLYDDILNAGEREISLQKERRKRNLCSDSRHAIRWFLVVGGVTLHMYRVMTLIYLERTFFMYYWYTASYGIFILFYNSHYI